MKEIQFRCNSKGEITIDAIVKTEGLYVVLVNEKDIPLARYSFDSNKIKHKEQISYIANNYKIDFDIVPTVIYENMPSFKGIKTKNTKTKTKNADFAALTEAR